jgi:hypothetical protein
MKTSTYLKKLISFCIGLYCFTGNAQVNSSLRIPSDRLRSYLNQPPDDYKLPLGANGEDIAFVIKPTHILPDELQAKYPQIKTFAGYDKNNPARMITLTQTDVDIRAVIMHNGIVLRLEPTGGSNYTFYQEEIFSEEKCGSSISASAQNSIAQNIISSGSPLLQRTQSTTWPVAGYGTQHLLYKKVLIPMQGQFAIDQNILSIAAGVAFAANFLNAISAKYTMEIGIAFELHPNNDLLIFLNQSDPYPDPPVIIASNAGGAGSLISRNQAICDSIIGNANYNLSCVLCRTGVAWGVYTAPCGTSQKAKVATYNSIGAINHEFGHAFTCPHTPAYTPSSGYSNYIIGQEPTTMGGGGDYFHCSSVETLADWVFLHNGNSCATISASGNSAPQLSSTLNGKNMPANTPFVLSNFTATDANAGQHLYYTWQSTDGGVVNKPDTFTNDPVKYLVFAPERPSLTGNVRYVPYLSNLAAGTNDPYSYLPSLTRDINVRLLVRDSVGGVNMTFETIHVDGNSGPFKVNTPVLGDVVTELQPITVNWSVAGTTAAPVSCANVDILLSTDGGLTFTTTILSNTPNDGTQTVTIPNGTATTHARVMVKGNGIFFNINPADFMIYDNALPADFAVFEYDTLLRACGSSATHEYIAQSLGGYSTPVTFTVAGLPAGVSSNLPQTVNPGQHLFVTLNGITTAMRGQYTLTLTATSGSVVKKRNLPLAIAGDIQPLNDYAMSALSTATSGVQYRAYSLNWDPKEYTIEYWMKFDPITMGVLSNFIYFGGSGNNNIQKTANNKIRFQYVNSGFSLNLVTSVDTVVPGKWYHIAGTYKNRLLKLYINGKFQGMNTYNILPVPWSNFTIGGSSNLRGISGEVEEFRIWSKERTLQQIREHMHLNLTAAEVCSGDVEFYMQFGQNAATAFDVTGRHPVTPINNPSSVISNCPTAAGVSVTKTVTATGAVSFHNAIDETKLDIVFNTIPNAAVVVSRLFSAPPGTQPVLVSTNPDYWVVHNYGDTLNLNATVIFEDAAFNTFNLANAYKLYKRGSNEFGPWASNYIASAASSTTHKVEFTGIHNFSQLSYGADPTAGIAERSTAEWTLFPNPAASHIQLGFANDKTAKDIKILDALGRVVIQLNSREQEIDIPIGSLNPGIYFVTVSQENSQSARKLIKQ